MEIANAINFVKEKYDIEKSLTCDKDKILRYACGFVGMKLHEHFMAEKLQNLQCEEDKDLTCPLPVPNLSSSHENTPKPNIPLQPSIPNAPSTTTLPSTTATQPPNTCVVRAWSQDTIKGFTLKSYTQPYLCYIAYYILP